MVRWIITVCAALALAGAGAARAQGPSLVVEADSGAVLHAYQPDQPWFPASLTKIMTAYLVFEALSKGRLTLDQEFVISKAAAAQPPGKAGLRAGRKLSIRTALDATIVASANDAAVFLAEAVAGSEAAFAAAMTRKARALGMASTRFANASGLPDKGQVTTARDMAKLARALRRDFPKRIGLFSQRRARFGKRNLSTTNGWLSAFEGADGLKTGFTCGSGYNLVGSAVRGGRRLLGVVLGGDSAGRRNAEMTRLLTAAFKLGANGRPRLDELPPEPSSARAAPELLGPSKCARSARSATRVALTAGNLPGWGVILGSYVTEAEAKAAIAESREAIKSAVRGGRAAIIGRDRDGLHRFSALLVGLKQGDAGLACKQLWDRGAYCLALTPEQLNHPKALWR